MPERVLITGGAGFIGSHLCERLLASGHAVLCLDDLSSGRPANLARCLGQERFEFVRGSILDEALVERLVSGVDRVVHLAAAVGVRRIVDAPLGALECNARGAALVFEAAARHGRSLLFSSSSEVYGKSARAPFRECGDLLLGPTTSARWGYACAKALAEFHALALARERGLRVCIARLFNTVGPRQSGRHGMVLPNFCARALRAQPLLVHGDGQQTRCFAHVLDTSEALARLLLCPEAEGEVVNVGAEEELSVLELARVVLARSGSRSAIVHCSYEQAYGPGFEDTPRRVPELEKLRRLTNFQPGLTLEEMVRDVLDDQRGQL